MAKAGQVVLNTLKNEYTLTCNWIVLGIAPVFLNSSAQSVVTFSRPRGYFDAQSDIRSISAEFNGERITGRTWRAAENRLVVLELTY